MAPGILIRLGAEEVQFLLQPGRRPLSSPACVPLLSSPADPPGSAPPSPTNWRPAATTSCSSAAAWIQLEAQARAVEQKHGVRVEALAADLSSDEGQRTVERRIAAADALELLVNNAGFGSRGRFWEIGVEEQDQMHRLHVLATMRLTHAALAKFVARGRGAIINVSSVAGFFASPGSVSYCATKNWMNAFTAGLAQELKAIRSPVKVQALCPGFTYSEFHDRLKFDRRQIPASLWLKADDVVAQSLRGLDRGKTVVVTGWRYRLIVILVRLLPMSLVRALDWRQRR